MDLTFPINFVGHDEWISSEYQRYLAQGDVVTRDGEFLGTWRAVDFDPEADDGGGCYEFLIDGHATAFLSQPFAHLDYRVSRGFALSTLTHEIRRWHETLSN